MTTILKAKWIGITISVFFLGCIIGYLFQVYTSDKYSFLSNGERISSCLSDSTIQKSDPASNMNDSLSFCYRKIWYQSALDDYNVRRHIFQNQYIADIILLWMVVVITLSGVCLAALQLYTSYDLSKYRLGKDGEYSEMVSTLEIEKGKVALKSSVTGLFILLISFGFFYIYVILVYKINEPVGSNTSAGKVLSSQISPYFSEKDLGNTGQFANGDPLQPTEEQSNKGGGFGESPEIEPNKTDN